MNRKLFDPVIIGAMALPHRVAMAPLTRSRAARHAIEAGMNGVEIHAGNGYLLNQFLNSNPDLPERMRRRARLNSGHSDLYFGGGAAGYTDCSALA